MAGPAKRATVYFDPVVHRALRMKAAAADRTLSDVVNDAVRVSLAEDAEDVAWFRQRPVGLTIGLGCYVTGRRSRCKI